MGLGLHVGKNDPIFNFYQMKEGISGLVKRKGGTVHKWVLNEES